MTIKHFPSMQELASKGPGPSTWWASTAPLLAELDQQLEHHRTADCAPRGAYVDSISRMPLQVKYPLRLQDTHHQLVERSGRLRRLLVTIAGDDLMATSASAQFATLVGEQDRYRRRAQFMICDSLVRDLEGKP